MMIRTTLRHCLSVLTVGISACTLCALGAVSSRAQTYDHLKCYKMRDTKAFKRASVDLEVLSGFFAGIDNCKLKGKAKEFCVPAAKTNLSVVGGSETPLLGQTQGFDRLCYKLKCRQSGLGPKSFADQFGALSLERFKAVKLCTPALMGPDPARCPVGFELGAIAGVGAGGAISPTMQETGFQGFFHDQDVPEGWILPLDATCPGTAPACGDCNLEGVFGAFGRCANDATLSCNTVNGPDTDDCGGAQCDFFLLPPRHLSGGGLPVCVQERLAVDVTGTFNNESGAAAIALDSYSDIMLGIALTQPCPVCSGDGAANDGVRGGVCSGGSRDGLGCDANGQDATWGPTSLDCPADPANRVSGPIGLHTALTLGDAAVSLPFATPCDFPFESYACACAVCSLDWSVACRDDTDCVGRGACDSHGFGVRRLPNGCSDLACSEAGGGLGECSGGPVESYCDGALRANGTGYIVCLTNADCDVSSAGNCSLSERRRCFADPIAVVGSAHPNLPVLADSICVPPISTELNPLTVTDTVIGLPGAKRVVRNFVVQRRY